MENNELLRNIQLTQLEIMKEIDRLCNKHDITYFLCAGTALGAIRHKGFIPWDDDLDIMCPRKDYKKLIEVMRKELSKDYWLQCYATDEHYWQPFAKVRKLGTVYKEKGMEQIEDAKCGIWVDIFPLDYAEKKGSFKLKWKRFWVKVISFSLRVTEFGLENGSFSRRYAPVIAILRCFPPNLLKKWQEDLMCGNEENVEWFVNLASTYEVDKETYPLEWFAEGVETPFEDSTFIIPKGYHEYLSQLYGDYMELPPLEKRRGHNISEVCEIRL